MPEMSIQCRTMLSQRPCGNPQCTRAECSGARVSAQVFMDGTNDDTKMWCPNEHGAQGTRTWCEYCGLDTVPGTNHATENDSTGPESVPQNERDTEPQYTLTGLSARDVERLEQALRMLRRTFTRESLMYQEVSELGARVSALTWDN